MEVRRTSSAHGSVATGYRLAVLNCLCDFSWVWNWKTWPKLRLSCLSSSLTHTELFYRRVEPIRTRREDKKKTFILLSLWVCTAFLYAKYQWCHNSLHWEHIYHIAKICTPGLAIWSELWLSEYGRESKRVTGREERERGDGVNHLTASVSHVTERKWEVRQSKMIMRNCTVQTEKEGSRCPSGKTTFKCFMARSRSAPRIIVQSEQEGFCGKSRAILTETQWAEWITASADTEKEIFFRLAARLHFIQGHTWPTNHIL